MPRSWKILPSSKTPENSTLWVYHLILPAYDTKRSHFLHYRTKIRKNVDQNRRVKFGYVARYALHVLYFLLNNHSLHHSKHHLLHHSKSHLLNYPYYTNHTHYNYIDITILL